MNVVNLKRRLARLECSSCGAGGEGTCDCGAPYVAAGTRAAAAVAENPGMSDRAIAAELGVDHKTVGKARRAGGDNSPVETRTGKDGKIRVVPAKPEPKASEPEEMPTEEEAEESWQNDLYDQARLLLEQMTDKTLTRLFAHIKRKYKS